MGGVDPSNAVWHKDVCGAAEQFVSAVTNERPGSCIDQNDRPICINADDCVQPAPRNAANCVPLDGSCTLEFICHHDCANELRHASVRCRT